MGQEKRWLCPQADLLPSAPTELLQCAGAEACAEVLQCAQGELCPGGSADTKAELHLRAEGELQQYACADTYQGSQAGLQWGCWGSWCRCWGTCWGTWCKFWGIPRIKCSGSDCQRCHRKRPLLITFK